MLMSDCFDSATARMTNCHRLAQGRQQCQYRPSSPHREAGRVRQALLDNQQQQEPYQLPRDNRHYHNSCHLE